MLTFTSLKSFNKKIKLSTKIFIVLLVVFFELVFCFYLLMQEGLEDFSQEVAATVAGYQEQMDELIEVPTQLQPTQFWFSNAKNGQITLVKGQEFSIKISNFASGVVSFPDKSNQLNFSSFSIKKESFTIYIPYKAVITIPSNYPPLTIRAGKNITVEEGIAVQ